MWGSSLLYFGDRSLRNVCAGRAGFHGIYRDVCAGCASPTAFTETFAQVAQVPRHLPGRLRKPRKSHGICFGVCGSSRKSRGICFGVCGSSRKSRGICFGVCGSYRKSHGICFGVCGSPASPAAFALAFAGVPASLAAFALVFAGVPASLTAFALAFSGVPQVPRRMLWRLRESRKSHGICFDVCGSFRKRFQEVGSARNNVATHAHCLTVSLPPPKKNSSR